MRNLIYTKSTALTTVAGTPLVFENIARRYGNCIDRTNTDSITIIKPGYYDVDINAVVTNGTAGALDLVLNLVQNGSIIDYGEASLATAATETVPIGAVVRVYCNSTAVIQVVPNTAGLTIDNLSVKVTEV